jgi:hypothetical protein
MNRLAWGVTTLGIGLVGFFVVAFASPFFVTQPSQGSGGMMGGSSMMGNVVGMMSWWFPGGNGTYSYPTGLWILPVAFLSVIVVGMAIVGYQAVLPEIKSPPTPPTAAGPVPMPAQLQADQPPAASLEAVLRTLKPDERKVFDALLAHDGRYLQKLLRSETGLSRLQVHRVVARLAERKLVSVRPIGNTNEVEVSQWLKKSSP